jgi:hypothetical protein
MWSKPLQSERKPAGNREAGDPYNLKLVFGHAYPCRGKDLLRQGTKGCAARQVLRAAPHGSP